MAAPKPKPELGDQVTLKINELKAQKLSNDQITAELSKLDMGWNLETGATGIGITPSPEDTATLPPMKNPFQIETTTNLLFDTGQKNAVIWTQPVTWTGFGDNMRPGSAAIASGQSHTKYITTHIGTNADGDWAEIGVLRRQIGSYDRWVFTYDGDEKLNGDNWQYVQYKSDMGAYDAYSIVLRGTSDANGWWYDIYFNYQWVRDGHLDNQQNWVNAADEVWSSTGTYTADTTDANWNNFYLMNQYGAWQMWSLEYGSYNYVPSNIWADYPQTYYYQQPIGSTVSFFAGTHP